MNIRIGLDLDNTIIDYRRAFESYLQENYSFKPEVCFELESNIDLFGLSILIDTLSMVAKFVEFSD